MIAYAQQVFDPGYPTSILDAIELWVGRLVPLLIAIAVVVLFWGIIQYIRAGAEDKAKAINLMVWAVVAIAVMVSIWGIVSLLQTTFGVGGVSTITPPQVP